MRWMMVVLLAIGLAAGHGVSGAVPQLERLSEEAAVFAGQAGNVIGSETLVQRMLQPPTRFRIRAGQSALKPPELRYTTRTVVSEYTYGGLTGDSGDLREFREVLEVDGTPVGERKEARRRLYSGLRKGGETAKKRILEDFAQHLPGGATTDFGQILLLFSAKQIANYEFSVEGERYVGAERVRILRFRQISGNEGVTLFEGRKVKSLPAAGRVLVRAGDGVPVRVEMVIRREVGGKELVDSANVDYAMSRFGFLLPVSVVHRRTLDGITTVENRYRYQSFQLFSAATEITFETDAENPKPPR